MSVSSPDPCEMQTTLLVNALMHEYRRCTRARFLFEMLQQSYRTSANKTQAISCYDAYVDYVSHLYEFYLGCIKRDERYPNQLSGVEVDSVIHIELERLLSIMRDRVERGVLLLSDIHPCMNYDASVPTDFGFQFRKVRNLRSHVGSERSTFDLAQFYRTYSHYVDLLHDYPSWQWCDEQVDNRDWQEIGRFANEISRAELNTDDKIC